MLPFDDADGQFNYGICLDDGGEVAVDLSLAAQGVQE
jgi:hypothetical protein